MSDDLTQQEADTLFALHKHRVNDARLPFPDPGGKLIAELKSLDERERFLLDLNRSSISIAKITFQNRARSIVVLARLDLGGAPHRNPDDTEIQCPHIHLYREGFDDKWAFEVPQATFRDLMDRWTTLHDFMAYCNVVEPPLIERSLLT